ARPTKEKRYLHLLIVGIGEQEAGKLRDRVLGALGAKAVSRDHFSLPNFEDGQLYGPLVATVDPDAMYYQLSRMKQTIERYASEGPSNQVVVVYYQGGEAVNSKGHFLRTSLPQIDEKLALYRIPCDELEKKLADTLGAKILLLDVHRDGSALDAHEKDRLAN